MMLFQRSIISCLAFASYAIITISIRASSDFVVVAAEDDSPYNNNNNNNIRRRRRRRRLESFDPKTVVEKEKTTDFDEFYKDYKPPSEETTTGVKEYNVGENNQWCKPLNVPPIDYDSCDRSKVPFNSIPLRSGLTNGLKFIILSIIKSIEDDNTCLFIDEKNSLFPKQFGPFLNNWFEPIGLATNSSDVIEAKVGRNTRMMPWQEVWNDWNARRGKNTFHTIDTLGYTNVAGHDLKHHMLKRIWRPLPSMRDHTCSKLEDYIQGEDYIALSMREGDKTEEGFKFASTENYIQKVEEIVPKHFGGVVPLIFVATDSCDPLQRLRDARPEWRIVSECDRVEQHGYAVQDIKSWTQEQTDEHYEKFWIELFAMAGAKVWIGVCYTNVAWWVYFMRENIDTFYVLRYEGGFPGGPDFW